MITEENREKASRGEEVLLGTYSCRQCSEPIEHWYVFERWCRATKHTSRCGFNDRRQHDEDSEGRDKAAEAALIEEYRRIHRESPLQQAQRAEQKKQEIARTTRNLAEAKAHLDTHTRCRSMAETIFALDHRVKPAEAMERARMFVDYYDAEEKGMRRWLESVEKDAEAAERL